MVVVNVEEKLFEHTGKNTQKRRTGNGSVRKALQGTAGTGRNL
jgi:hypothetical protein